MYFLILMTTMVNSKAVQEKMKGNRNSLSQVIFGHGAQFFRGQAVTMRVAWMY